MIEVNEYKEAKMEYWERVGEALIAIPSICSRIGLREMVLYEDQERGIVEAYVQGPGFVRLSKEDATHHFTLG
ncbi:MAG: hypothetical protein Q8M92_08585 [Candidatus Subteraquimicrobiales bacterium]|nr:hypothetical protein [Candidatus Subteraquimicrobiales bacterium]